MSGLQFSPGLHPAWKPLVEPANTRQDDRMDPEDRLDLIRMLAQDQGWDAVVLIGRVLLDAHYPADIFDGSSGDPGPGYIVALREALRHVDEIVARRG